MTETTSEAQTEEKPRVSAPNPDSGRRDALPTIVHIAVIPAVISDAISAITGELGTVSKGAYNEFDKYSYTSVDQIYELVASHLAQRRLNIIPIELADVMIVTGPDGKNWGKFVIGFVFTLGDVQYFDPHMRETLFIRINGPQTFSGAKSYAQKSFLRHLFKIATGEPDLDSLPSDGDAPKGNNKASVKKADKPSVVLSPEQSGKLRGEILGHIATLKKPISPEDRTLFAERYGASIASMATDDAAIIRKAYGDAARAKAS